MNIIPTVGGLIKYKNLYLFVKTLKWKGKWGIPGGKVNAGETLIQALIREIKEETNLDVRKNNCQFITFFEAIFDEEFYKPIHMILFNYLVKVNNIDFLSFNEEIVDFVWLKKEDFRKIKMNKYTNKLVKIIEKRWL